jgi:hypothetical protein
MYLYGIIFLYLTGLYHTLTTHEWSSWGFVRSLSFNFFGFLMALLAWRAIRLFARTGNIQVEPLDYALAILLSVSVIGLFFVAVRPDTPMRGFTLIGIILTMLELRDLRDLRSGVLPKPLHYRRHQRYVLASYFYVLTVVSLVHLKGELPREVKWLWSPAIGGICIWMLAQRARWTGAVVTAVVVLSELSAGMSPTT